MLATECARTLGYRDSYLLFNKNRSLHKINATPQEKEDLINQEIIPYSYRSRQIALVTAKSIFRQFGARVIEGGRRVRDDYWEAKAIKQGQDYQMQILLLEQQNKKCLLMARQEQDTLSLSRGAATGPKLSDLL